MRSGNGSEPICLFEAGPQSPRRSPCRARNDGLRPKTNGYCVRCCRIETNDRVISSPISNSLYLGVTEPFEPHRVLKRPHFTDCNYAMSTRNKRPPRPIFGDRSRGIIMLGRYGLTVRTNNSSAVRLTRSPDGYFYFAASAFFFSAHLRLVASIMAFRPAAESVLFFGAAAFSVTVFLATTAFAEAFFAAVFFANAVVVCEFTDTEPARTESLNLVRRSVYLVRRSISFVNSFANPCAAASILIYPPTVSLPCFMLWDL